LKPRRLVEGGLEGEGEMHSFAQCEFKTVLEWATAALALLAALFWFASTWSGRTSFRKMSVGMFDEALRKQARNSAIAAAFAGLSAVSQLITLYLPVCRAFG
jgi:hypothetical protein